MFLVVGMISIVSFNHQAFASTGTQIYLNDIPNVLYLGQEFTFSGKLVTSDGYPIGDATIHIGENDVGPDDTIGKGITNSNGEFRITVIVKDWDSWTSANEIYAKFEKTSQFAKFQTANHVVSIVQKQQTTQKTSNYDSTYSKPSTSSKYLTKLTLDPITTHVYSGQKITFSGKLTSSGQPLKNAEIMIKDEDTLDFDDVLATAITDANGRFSKTWSVKDVDSSDRKKMALVATLLDPTLSTVPTLNKIFNMMESDTIEIYAEFSGTNLYQKSKTCSTENCNNNIMIIDDMGASFEDQVVSAALDRIIPGGGKTTQDSDLLYSVLSSDKISEKQLNRLLAKALADELGVSSSDYSIDELLAMMEEQ